MNLCRAKDKLLNACVDKNNLYALMLFWAVWHFSTLGGIHFFFMQFGDLINIPKYLSLQCRLMKCHFVSISFGHSSHFVIFFVLITVVVSSFLIPCRVKLGCSLTFLNAGIYHL